MFVAHLLAKLGINLATSRCLIESVLVGIQAAILSGLVKLCLFSLFFFFLVFLNSGHLKMDSPTYSYLMLKEFVDST